MISSMGNYIPQIVKKFYRTLPHFPDGRINYSKSDSAAIMTCFISFRNKILLLKRSEKVGDYQGKWSTVTGFLDELKSLEQKVIDEIKEETGITKDTILKLKKARPYKFFDKNLRKTWIIHPVLVKLKNAPKIVLDWEHTEYLWVKLETISKYDLVTNLENTLKTLISYKRKYSTGLLVGRFQPFHKGHLYLIKQALIRVNNLIIAIGSANVKDKSNPFNYKIRERMLRLVVEKERLQESIIKIIPLNDYFNDDIWLKKTIDKVGKVDCIIGNNEWVNNIFKKAGYKVIRIKYYKRDIFESKKIRRLIRSKKKWQDRVPLYLASEITNLTKFWVR